MFVQVPHYDDAGRFHKRKSPRLQNYDYAQPNYYFITICTNGKQCLFGTLDQLSKSGQIADAAFAEIPKHFQNVTIDKYVVMPNHVHAIVAVHGEGTHISLVIGHYKSYVSRQIHLAEPNKKIWQDSFHDHVIRNQADYSRIWAYIDTNPAKWDNDCFYCSHSKE